MEIEVNNIWFYIAMLEAAVLLWLSIQMIIRDKDTDDIQAEAMQAVWDNLESDDKQTLINEMQHCSDAINLLKMRRNKASIRLQQIRG